MNRLFGEVIMNNLACEKLKTLLLDDDLGKTMKKKKITMATINDLFYGLRDLSKNAQTTTVSSDAMRIYKECGFLVSPDGIGWLVQ